jgi:hypothetical protein
VPGMKEAVRDYLRQIDQFEPQSLGKRRRPITPQDSQFLRERIGHQARINDRIIVIAVTLLVCLFGLGVSLIIYDLGSVRAEAAISGTTFASLLVVVRFLRRLWLDKSRMDLLYLATSVLGPEELAKLATSFYYDTFDRRRETVTVHQDARFSV